MGKFTKLIEKMEKEHIAKNMSPGSLKIPSEVMIPLLDDSLDFFKEGYQKCLEKYKYTEDDIIKSKIELLEYLQDKILSGELTKNGQLYIYGHIDNLLENLENQLDKGTIPIKEQSLANKITFERVKRSEVKIPPPPSPPPARLLKEGQEPPKPKNRT